jgi:hypothetical protein
MSRKNKHRKMGSKGINTPEKQDSRTADPQPNPGEKGDSVPPSSSVASEIESRPSTPPNAGHCHYEGTPRYMRIFEIIAVLSGVAYAIITACLWRDAHHNFRVDERAWVSVVTPPNYSLDSNGRIVVVSQVQNVGKTPARIVEGKAMGIIRRQGDDPNFSAEIKPPYTALHFPALFQNVPGPVVFPILHYFADQPIPASQAEVADGKSNIFVYGQLTFDDIFGNHHWTHFCVSYPIPIKECVRYNDTDGN